MRGRLKSTILIIALCGMASERVISDDLWDAAERGDLVSVGKFISKGVDVNSKKDGRTPIHYALSRIKSEFGGAEGGVIITYFDNWETVELLLDNGADPEIRNPDKKYPVYLAVIRGLPKTVNSLLENGAPLSSTKYGEDPLLYIATRYGKTEVIKVLFKRGADLAELAEDKQTALHYACYWNKTRVVKTILEFNPDLNLKAGVFMGTPLHTFADRFYGKTSNDIASARLMIEAGANMDAQDSKKRTPLHLAIENIDLLYAELLITNGAGLEIKDSENKTPLMRLASFAPRKDQEEDYLKISKLIIKNGVNLDESNNFGNTALHLASASWREYDHRIIDLLINNGANPNALNRKGITPVHLAAAQRFSGRLLRLLENEVSLNIRDYDGDTPLHKAVQSSSSDNVRLLLLHGANPTIKNDKGELPRDFAKGKNKDTILELLDKFKGPRLVVFRGSLRFRVDGVAGRTYEIMHSTDLIKWTVLDELTLTLDWRIYVDRKNTGPTNFYTFRTKN